MQNKLKGVFDYTIMGGFRDRVTNTLKHSIPDFIKYLFKEYGKLLPEELIEKEDGVKFFVHDTTSPVSVGISNLKDLYELTGD